MGALKTRRSAAARRREQGPRLNDQERVDAWETRCLARLSRRFERSIPYMRQRLLQWVWEQAYDGEAFPSLRAALGGTGTGEG